MQMYMHYANAKYLWTIFLQFLNLYLLFSFFEIYDNIDRIQREKRICKTSVFFYLQKYYIQIKTVIQIKLATISNKSQATSSDTLKSHDELCSMENQMSYCKNNFSSKAIQLGHTGPVRALDPVFEFLYFKSYNGLLMFHLSII